MLLRVQSISVCYNELLLFQSKLLCNLWKSIYVNKKINMAANNSKKSADADIKLTVVLRHNLCVYSDYKNIQS